VFNVKFVAPSWNDIYDMSLKLAVKIDESGFKPQVIVGIARGGWVVARLLSDFLDVPRVASLRVEFYKSIYETERKPILSQPLSTNVNGLNVLLADDVADTGSSLILARDHALNAGAKEVRIATLYYKPWSQIKPDYYVAKTDAWIIFPHEIRETIEKVTDKLIKEGVKGDGLKNFLLAIGIKEELVNYFLPKVLAKLQA